MSKPYIRGYLIEYVRPFIVLAALFPTVVSDSMAENLYTWEDEKGVVHYSSKPKDGRGRLAELPPITRADVKLTERKLVTCDAHGGVNCAAGPDADGSVLCFDGFRGASGRFRFMCTAPKLQVSDISELTPDGGFSVFLRNAKAAPAERPAVSYSPEGKKDIALTGPDQIEPYGVAEFTFDAKIHGAVREKPDAGQINISCANCPG